MSLKIKTIVVDDEQHARQALIGALKRYQQIEVVAECEQGVDAIKAINACRPQLVFLDIHMPRLDGFDVLELLGDEAPLLVFVTAYDGYALRAFEGNALDYLLKPIDPKRLDKTMERVAQRLKSNDAGVPGSLLLEHKKSNAPLQRILIRDGGDVHVIPVDDVQYVESADDYVAVQVEGKTFIKQERLHHLEKLLDERNFCRIHRSYLLNINYLSGIEAETKDSKVALLQNGKRLPISRSGYARLRVML